MTRLSRSGHSLHAHESGGEWHGDCRCIDRCVWRGAGFATRDALGRAWARAHGWTLAKLRRLATAENTRRRERRRM